jgi:glycosyltransferase involved in cell wall biosynthesis
MLVIYVARLRPERQELSVSVVVPARNERDNLKPLLAEFPKLGTQTELIVVEGHSTDGTYERALELAKEIELKVLR